MPNDAERCIREIVEIEAQIRGGNPDLQGLCLALGDWSAELRLIQANSVMQTLVGRKGQ